MKAFSQKHLDKILLVFLPLAAGLYLWLRSGPPPYGYPLNEMSDHYWGILIDMARKWQSGHFVFWDRSIGGGFCLYSSGFYPLWLPTNIAALFLSLDHFYLFKLTEPYVVGIFCAFLLLRFGLKLDLTWACFGTIAYTGFVFTRAVGILHHPFFIWACALYPLMIYVYHRFFLRPFYLRASILGALMAVVFLGGGAGQFVQLIIWTLMLLTLDAFVFTKIKIQEWLIGCAAFIFFAFALAGIQILPTLAYAFFESNRTLGEYAINNFPWFKKDYKGTTSLTDMLQNSFFFGGRDGVRAFWALMIFSVGRFILDYKLFRDWLKMHKSIAAVSLATILFFLLPPTAQFIADILPSTRPLFKPLTMVTFGYCGFMIDLLLVLFLVIVFSPKAAPAKVNQYRDLILLIFLVVAEIYLFLPFWLNQAALSDWLRPLVPQYQLMDTQISLADRFLTMVVLIMMAFPFFLKMRGRSIIILPALLFLGSQLLFSSYICGGKGVKPSERFYFEAPEHQVYRSMKGHYYLAYVDEQGQGHQYQTMTHNYDLLFGVHGVNGYLNMPPARFDNFARAYHKEAYWTRPNKTGYKYSFGATPASLTTHFPVEFTTIRKGMTLPWPSFKKVVNGAEYDVWVRERPPERVQFADQIKVVSFRELLASFDRPYEGIVYMTPEDFTKYQLRPENLADHQQARYENFRSVRTDHLTFDVSVAGPSIVVLPEMFQGGWRLKIDGKPQKIFPANYIFIGFLVSPGEHRIELVYRPVLWELGIVINFLAIGIFFWLIKFSSTIKKRK